MKIWLLLLFTIPALAFAQNLEVVALFPTQHATTAAPGTPIGITFSAPIDTTALHEQITVYGDIRGLYVPTIEIDSSGNRLNLTTPGNFAIGEKIRVILHRSLRGANGQTFSGFQWQFRIQPTLPTAPGFHPPIVSAVQPFFVGNTLVPFDFGQNPFVNIAILNAVITVATNNGNGNMTFSQQIPGNDIFNPDIGIFDFNRDNQSDLMAFAGIFSQTTTTSFQFAQGTSSYIHDVIDMNNDGYPDLISTPTISRDAQAVGIYYYTDGSPYTNLDTLLVDSLIVDAVGGDFNNDGTIDIAYITQVFATPGGGGGHNSVRILFLDTSGDTLDWVVYNGSDSLQIGFPSQISAADLNNDGYLDIFIGTNAGDVVLFNNPMGLFRIDDVIHVGGGDAFHWTNVADMNGDGRLDLIKCNEISFEVAGGCGYVLNTDSGFVFGPEVQFRTGSRPVHVSSGDFNADGAIDLCVLWNDGLRVYLNDPLLGIATKKTPVIDFRLSPNYPNPFNGETTLQLFLTKTQKVRSALYNTRGQVVRHFDERSFPAGKPVLKWDGRDQSGRDVASGVYFWRLKVGQQSHVAKVVLQR